MNAPQSNARTARFFEIWKNSLSQVLAQVGLVSPQVAALDEKAANDALPQMGDKAHWGRFTGGGLLRGELALATSQPEALQLAQLLMSEPADRTVEFSSMHRDAFAELVRQVSGQVATQWKSEAGGETLLTFADAERPSWKSATIDALSITGENFPAVTLVIQLQADLAASLAPPAAAEIASTAGPASAAPPEEIEIEDNEIARSESNKNLDLLLDVELEATIRFGQRRLLLKDILSMTPGAVVELDRQINEPAELLVAGRLVARGEVVVVDGSFGLRVTELASERQRAEILQGAERHR